MTCAHPRLPSAPAFPLPTNTIHLRLLCWQAGGYYDHVVPPSEGVPADDSPCHLTGPHTTPPYKCPGGGEAFDFRRLGLRTTAMLISPWVAKGAIFQEPQRGPFPTSQFDLTSIVGSIKNLFNLSSFLTKRDEWAGNFEEVGGGADAAFTKGPSHLYSLACSLPYSRPHLSPHPPCHPLLSFIPSSVIPSSPSSPPQLLLDTPRTDAPYHLPEAPKAAAAWDPPPPEAMRTTPGDGRFMPDDDGEEEEEKQDDDDKGGEIGGEIGGEGGGGGGGDGVRKDEGDDQRRVLSAVGVDGSVLGGERPSPIPQHCSSVHGSGVESPCKGHTKPNLKQRRNLRWVFAYIWGFVGSCGGPVGSMACLATLSILCCCSCRPLAHSFHTADSRSILPLAPTATALPPRLSGCLPSSRVWKNPM